MFNIDRPVVYVANIKRNPILQKKNYKIIKCENDITAGWHKTGIDVGESTASLSYKLAVLCKTSLPA
jgi:hypothetical protein